MGETPGAPPADSGGEQGLCATGERSRRQNPTRRRRTPHQPKASGGAKPFSAAEEPLTPPAPLLPPKKSRFFPGFPVFPKRRSPGDPTAPPSSEIGGHREAAVSAGSGMLPTETPQLILVPCRNVSKSNQETRLSGGNKPPGEGREVLPGSAGSPLCHIEMQRPICSLEGTRICFSLADLEPLTPKPAVPGIRAPTEALWPRHSRGRRDLLLPWLSFACQPCLEPPLVGRE